MNIVVLNRSDWLDERRVRLVDRRADHIRSVLRAAVGDSIRVGELNGDLGQGRICALDADAVVLEVDLNSHRRLAIGSTLFLPCRGQRCCAVCSAPWPNTAWPTFT